MVLSVCQFCENRQTEGHNFLLDARRLTFTVEQPRLWYLKRKETLGKVCKHNGNKIRNLLIWHEDAYPTSSFDYHISRNIFFLSVSNKRQSDKYMNVRKQDRQKSPNNYSIYVFFFCDIPLWYKYKR